MVGCKSQRHIRPAATENLVSAGVTAPLLGFELAPRIKDINDRRFIKSTVSRSTRLSIKSQNCT